MASRIQGYRDRPFTILGGTPLRRAWDAVRRVARPLLWYLVMNDTDYALSTLGLNLYYAALCAVVEAADMPEEVAIDLIITTGAVVGRTAQARARNLARAIRRGLMGSATLGTPALRSAEFARYIATGRE